MKKLSFWLGLLGNLVFAALYLISYIRTAMNEDMDPGMLHCPYIARGWEISSPIIILLFVAAGIAGASLIRKKATAASIMLILSGVAALYMGGWESWRLLWSLPQLAAGRDGADNIWILQKSVPALISTRQESGRRNTAYR